MCVYEAHPIHNYTSFFTVIDRSGNVFFYYQLFLITINENLFFCCISNQS
jgi:hypothetical protein